MSDDSEMIERHLAQLENDAKAFDVIAAAFRPEFEACWSTKDDGTMGPLKDSEKALRLRPFVIENESNAKYNRKLKRALEWALGM